MTLISSLVNKLNSIRSGYVNSIQIWNWLSGTFKLIQRRGRGLVPQMVFNHPHRPVVTLGVAIGNGDAVVIGFGSRNSW